MFGVYLLKLLYNVDEEKWRMGYNVIMEIWRGWWKEKEYKMIKGKKR